MFKSPFFATILASLILAGSLSAAEMSPAELKMREALKNTMIQLRTAQTENATLQATQAASDAEKAKLTDQLAALTKQCADDKAASDKTLGELKDKIAAQEANIAKLNEALEEWKAAQKKAADIAATKEAQRAKLAAEKIVLDRRVAEQQTKNDAMFKLGNEILTRYEKFGLGDALTAREPFVGLTRVKFENLIQDYSDKLGDQKIQP